MATAETRTPGSWWYWYYKDAIKVGETIPSFEAQGRKKWFGLSRAQMSSPRLFQQLKFPVASCIVFFPRADYTVDQFAAQLKSSFKTAITMGKHAHNIHVFVTCASVDEFDKKTERSPSGVNLWADVNGEIAERFGMRPMLQVVDVADILAFGDEDNGKQKRRYERQTQTGMFFLLSDRIIKSPGYQPRLQTANVGTIKTAFEAMEAAGYGFEKCTTKDSFAADLTERELQTRHHKAWSVYEEEHGQMMEDMHGGKSRKEGKRRRRPSGKKATRRASKISESATSRTVRSSQGTATKRPKASVRPTTTRAKSKPSSSARAKKTQGSKEGPDGFIRSKL